MRDLKEVLEKLTETEAEAAINPEDTNPNVRAGVEALVRNAKSRLASVHAEYRDAVMDKVVIIAVNGTGAKPFADMATKLGAISVDFEQVTQQLASNLLKRAVGDLYTSSAHFMLLDELSSLRLKYDMVRLPTPQVNAYSDGIYDFPIYQAIQKLLAKNYGTGLQSAITRREIGNKALEARFSGSKLPVVVYNIADQVDTQFIPNPFTTIEVDDKVTEAIVKKKLTEIKANLKKSSLMDETIEKE